MDPAKLRLIAGVGGTLFGFAGLVALMIAAVIALSAVMGLAWATFTISMIFLALGCVGIVIFLKPYKAAEEEMNQFGEATADALADLPFDTIISMFEKRPLTMSALGVFIGYSMFKNPSQATSTIQRAMLAIL